MHFVEKPGTSLAAMTRITIDASKELRSIPGVKNFGSHIGRAEVADEVVGPNFTELWISVDEKAPYKETVTKIEDAINGYPGLVRDVLTYLREQIKEVLTGAGATIVVRLYGPDMDVLRAKAKEVYDAAHDIPGVMNLKVEQQVLVPQLDVRLRPDAAARLGLTPGDVRRAATTLVKGQKVGELYDQQKMFDVFVWGVEKVRDDVNALRDLPIETPAGAHVRLGDVADVAMVPAPNLITRENAMRKIDVTCNVTAGADLGEVARAIEAKVKAVKFDREYLPRVPGRIRRPRGVEATPDGPRGALAPRRPAHHPRRLQDDPPDGPGLRHPAVRADRRRLRRGARRRGPVARLAGRVRDRPRDRREERDHARQPLPPSGGGGRASRSASSWSSEARSNAWRRS